MDRSSHTRINLSRKVGVRTSDGIIYLWTYDLARNGMQLYADDLSPFGKEHDVYLHVITPQNGKGSMVHARLQFRQRIYVGSSECFRTGGSFTKFYGDSEQHYAEYIDSLLQRSGRMRSQSSVTNRLVRY